MLTKQYKFYEPIAPYITLSYHDQILIRNTLLNKSLNQLKVNSINNTVKSPLIRNFRNKNRFVIGMENNKPVIGYKYGINSKNIFCLTQIPDEDLIYPRIEIKQFIKEHLIYLKKSKLKPFDKSQHIGFWKFITFRYSEYENAYSIQYTIELRYTDKKDVDLEIEEVIKFCNNSCLNIKSVSFKDCYDKEYSINHKELLYFQLF
tara:strand:+ start:517 stop:1128 length:612 start_codon:yes stop_codon:yes gene_type:complete